jgi:hypothetical protein
MKIKQEIWWVVGELPETESLKLVAVELGDRRDTAIASYRASSGLWEFSAGFKVPAKVLAWASMPAYEGFPAEGQKVEFTNVHKCDQDPRGSAGIPADPHPDPVVERLIEAVKMLGREAQRQLGKEYAEAGLYERPGINSKLYWLGSLDEYVRTGKDQP